MLQLSTASDAFAINASARGLKMPDNALNFLNWSVLDWSVSHELLALTLGKFTATVTGEGHLQKNQCFKARCHFVVPSRVRFSQFIVGSNATICKMIICPIDAKLSMYRLSLDDGSFL